MRNIKLTTITLKSRDFKEKDRIITCISREWGKYDLMAKGVQKPLTKLSGISSPITYSTLIVSNLKNLGTISSCNIIESFTRLRSDLNALSHALYLLELTEKSTAEGCQCEEIFDTLLGALYSFEKEVNPDLVTRFFEHNLINILGYNINTKTCLGCGKELKEKIFYNMEFGGFFCENCVRNVINYIQFPNALLSYIEALNKYNFQKLSNLTFPDKALDALSKLYKTHLSYRIDRNINSLEFISQQKQITKN